MDFHMVHIWFSPSSFEDSAWVERNIDWLWASTAVESIQWDSGQRSHAFEVDGAKAPAFSFKKLSQNSPQRRTQCEQKPEREKSFKVNEFKAGESPYFLTKEKAN